MSEMKYTPGPWEIDHETRPAEVCTVYRTSHPQSFVYVRGAIGYVEYAYVKKNGM